MPETGDSTRSRGPTILGSAGAILFVLAPAAAFSEVVRPLTGFYLFALGGLLGILALLASLMTVFRSGLRAALQGLVLGGITTAAFLFLALPARNFPRINDISTDPQNPPKFVQATAEADNVGRDLSYPGEAFALQQAAGYPGLGPVVFDAPPAAVYERVVKAAQRMPRWTITRTDAAALAVEGYATSRLFRFKDDFVIEVRPAEAGAVVHMRSKSRDGRGDLGANAARIEAFFAKLRE